MIQRRVFITGKVQGVGFRAATIREAQRYPVLRGWSVAYKMAGLKLFSAEKMPMFWRLLLGVKWVHPHPT